MSVSFLLRGLLLTLLCGGLTLWSAFSLGEGDYTPAFVTAGAVAWCLILQLRPLILTAAILCFFGHLTLPGIPEQLNLTLLAGLYFLPLIPIQMVMGKHRSNLDFSHFCLLGYALWLILLICIHGLGLLQLGGGQIGGADYIRSFAAFGFFFACLSLPLPATWWPRILIGGLFLLILPIAADLIIQFKADYAEVFRKFIDLPPMAVGLSQANELGNADLFNRFVTLAFTSILGVGLIFCLRPSSHILSVNKGVPWILLILGFYAINTLAGSREAMFNLLLFSVLFLVLDRAVSPAGLLVVGSGMAAGALAVSFFFVKYLPLSIQRVFSVLPWAEVSHLASADAGGTWTWRKELWALGWNEVPQNLFIGKGFSYDFHAYAFGRQSALDWAYISSSYHMSHLDFLIKTGLPGLILFYSFLLFSAIRHWRIQKQAWRHPRLRHFHLVFYALFIAGIATFLTLYGDTGRSIMRFTFYVGILEALRLSDLADDFTAESTRS